MTGTVIDGRSIAEAIKGGLRPHVEALRAKGRTPGLAAVLVGEDPASKVYVQAKAKACGEVGVRSEVIERPATLSEDALVREILDLNERPDVHGILVQQPLPAHMREDRIVAAVSPEKDVDCFHPENLGLLLRGTPRFAPATPQGIVELLVRSGHPPEGRHVVILGRSNIVGKPLAAMLLRKAEGGNATVTVCHTGTRALPEITRTADILVAAIGRPRFVRAEMVREGVVAVDVGVNRVPDPTRKSGTRLVGDMDFDGVRPRAAAITPVPGGVGPMTIAMLLRNTVAAAGPMEGG